MSSEAEGSITRCLARLRAGDPAGAQPLWERYFGQLVRVARARRRPAADADEEDAALSAFDSFCAGAARGRFPRLADRGDLWRLLVVITTRKARAQARRQGRQKRGGGLVYGEADLGGAGGPEEAGLLAEVMGREPSPEFAALVAEEYRRLLDQLGDESLRQVALWRLEGYTNDEIAERLGCARRTVARRLELIRKIWLAGGP
jgi:DNA-directed RNA polymerase specialized sigma24 family protein